MDKMDPDSSSASKNKIFEDNQNHQ